MIFKTYLPIFYYSSIIGDLDNLMAQLNPMVSAMRPVPHFCSKTGNTNGMMKLVITAECLFAKICQHLTSILSETKILALPFHKLWDDTIIFIIIILIIIIIYLIQLLNIFWLNLSLSILIYSISGVTYLELGQTDVREKSIKTVLARASLEKRS